METNTRNLPTFTEAQTPLKELFKLFCGLDDLRPELQSPFEINNSIYATDAYTLITCFKLLCDFTCDNTHKTPRVDGIIPKNNLYLTLHIHDSDFDKYKTADEYDIFGADVVCTECNGAGEVEWEYEHWTKDFACPKCDGEGLEDRVKRVKNGNKTIGNSLVKIGEAYFQMHLFYRLLKARQILNNDIVLISYEAADKPALFQVGFCQILLMPIMYHADHEFEGILELPINI